MRQRYNHGELMEKSAPDSWRNEQAELDRLQDAELLRLVVDTAVAAVVTMNEDGLISGWGARAEETFGWSRAEVLGVPLVDLIVPQQYRDAHNKGLAQFRSSRGGPVLGADLEVSALRKSGEIH